MSDSNTPHQAPPPADVVAHFIEEIKQACAASGEPLPSFVANWRPGDTALYRTESPLKDKHNADFEYDVTPDKLVSIVDLDLGNRSVTNDIEHVLGKIASEQGLASLAGHLVTYRDSTGEWDEARLDENGQFKQFWGLGAHSEDEALAKLRARRASA